MKFTYCFLKKAKSWVNLFTYTFSFYKSVNLLFSSVLTCDVSNKSLIKTQFPLTIAVFVFPKMLIKVKVHKVFLCLSLQDTVQWSICFKQLFYSIVWTGVARLQPELDVGVRSHWCGNLHWKRKFQQRLRMPATKVWLAC